ncbi:MAG: fluoride efflux transporter CrcB [Dysgonamonadaceae bacterium]|jgi:CrcB protein|nr:fluoride efflux transporter CrcB [Dysgonamonadaceae bacterium]
MITKLLWVGLGGGVGSIFRYLTSVAVNKYATGTVFPFATFMVNILGCLIIGILIGLSAKHHWIGEPLKLLLITGFCGGYTTFSTFSLENLQLQQAGHFFVLALYIAASVLVGLAAVYIGLLLGK